MIGEGDCENVLDAGTTLPENDPYIDTLVHGRYRIRSLLGYGGWSMVYLATDQMLKRDVALKLLYLPLAADEEKRKRFEQEARAASSLNHPGIATVFDFGVMPHGQPFMVLEHLEGHSLSDLIESSGPMPAAHAIEIICQVASALEHAHAKGIIHRDIKPSNIFVTTYGGTAKIVKILDFGLAKWIDNQDLSQLTATGKAVGTPSYMSPEQCRGEELDARSDVYSLGCTLYELLSGVKPFTGSVLECMHAHLNQEPPPINSLTLKQSVPVGLESVVRKSMAKDREDRPASAAAFREAVRNSLQQTDNALLPLWWRLSHSTNKIHKMLTAVVVTTLCLAGLYMSAPVWLPVIGVHSVQTSIDDMDPVALESVAIDLENRGQVRQAEDMLEAALALSTRKRGAKSQTTAATALVLSKFYIRNKNYKAAAGTLNTAARAFEQTNNTSGIELTKRLLKTVQEQEP